MKYLGREVLDEVLVEAEGGEGRACPDRGGSVKTSHLLSLRITSFQFSPLTSFYLSPRTGVPCS